MRTVLWDIVSEIVGPDIPPTRIIASASADSHYQTPFAIIKSRGSFPGASKGAGGGTSGCEIWIHDTYGSYDRINRILLRLRRQLRTKTPRFGDHGAVLAEIGWDSESPDLNDDGYGTICRMISVTMAGVDGEHPDPTP